MQLNDLLIELVEKEGSDLHLRAGEPPVFRIHGHITRTDHEVLTPESLQELVYSILTPEHIKRYETNLELDLAYEIKDVSRFRVNVFRESGSVAAVFRAIPSRVKTVEELGLPLILKQIAEYPRGFVLVTGPTGSGKSTTLAAMLNHINETRRGHIITIEDPIEFWHEDKQCTVTQREIGQDTESFAAALRHVLRQNPDVILVGEMRDVETISLAITAAETGHLVFATLHTIDAPQTIDRIIDVFEPDQQDQVRIQLSTILQAVISQTLLPRADRPGRVAAFEIMIVTHAIRALIRQGRTEQIYNNIQSDREIGSQTLDTHLLQLVRDGIVAFEEALLKSSNPAEFRIRAAEFLPEAKAAVVE